MTIFTSEANTKVDWRIVDNQVRLLFVNLGVGVEEGSQQFQTDDRCNRLDEPGRE